MPGAESQVGLGMGEMMVTEAGAQHDSTDERTFQKIPSRKTTAHRKPPFFSLRFSTTPHLYIMPRKKSMTDGLRNLGMGIAECGLKNKTLKISEICNSKLEGRYLLPRRSLPPGHNPSILKM
jgi:hypothetical protein